MDSSISRVGVSPLHCLPFPLPCLPSLLETANSHFPCLAGDLLRAEQARPDSTYGAMIKEYITEGKIVPMEVTIKVISSVATHTLTDAVQLAT